MAELSCGVSETENVVQTMLSRLRLREQRVEQASTTSEDLTARTLQDVEDVEMCVDGGASARGEQVQSPRSRWPGLFKGHPKLFGLRRGSTERKEKAPVSDMDVPKWDRKQFRFPMVAELMSGNQNCLFDEVQGQLKSPLNHDNHLSPADGSHEGLGSSALQPCVDPQGPQASQDSNASSQPNPNPPGVTGAAGGSELDSFPVSEDNMSSTEESLSRESPAPDQTVPSKGPNTVRKQKRKWAETRTKKLSQKIRDKWRERRSSGDLLAEQNRGESGEKECQVNTAEQSPSTVSNEAKENVVHLQPPARKTASDSINFPQRSESFLLGGFELAFSTTTLMEEIFTSPEWTKFLGDNAPSTTRHANDQSTYLNAMKPIEINHPRSAISQPECTLNGVTGETLPVLDSAEEALGADQAICSESLEETVNHLAAPEALIDDQLTGALGEEVKERGSPEPSLKDPQPRMDQTDQSEISLGSQNQSETGSESDYLDALSHTTEGDDSPSGKSDTNPLQNENPSSPSHLDNPSEVNPYQTERASPILTQINTSGTDQPCDREDTSDTVLEPGRSQMLNPYLTEPGEPCKTVESNTADPDQGPQVTEDVMHDVPQFVPVVDYFFLKSEEEEDRTAHARRRKALNSEERESFIDEDDDDIVTTSRSNSHKTAPLSPPPFAPPPPPPQHATQRSISLDSDSSVFSMETEPKKRKLDPNSPRRVHFAAEVVMLPRYVQTEVEEMPDKDEGDEMDSEDTWDEEEDDVMAEEEEEEEEGRGLIQEAMERAASEEAQQPSLYNWILGFTKKTKRKTQT